MYSRRSTLKKSRSILKKKNKGLASIGQLVDNIFRDPKDVRLKLLSEWNSIVGSLKDIVFLEKIQRDTMFLGVNDSSWLQELFLLSEIFVQRINEKLGDSSIKHLKFRQRTYRKKHQALSKVKLEKFVKKSNLSTAKSKMDLEKIKDSKLKDSMAMFLCRCCGG